MSAPTSPMPAQAGYTLVEVMVSSLILALAVSGIVAMIINAGSRQAVNDHNRQARMIVREELEDDRRNAYQYANPLMPGENNNGIYLDHNLPSGGIGTLRIVTITSLATPAICALPGVNVPYRKIVASLGWYESGKATSLTISRRIVQVQ